VQAPLLRQRASVATRQLAVVGEGAEVPVQVRVTWVELGRLLEQRQGLVPVAEATVSILLHLQDLDVVGQALQGDAELLQRPAEVTVAKVVRKTHRDVRRPRKAQARSRRVSGHGAATGPRTDTLRAGSLATTYWNSGPTVPARRRPVDLHRLSHPHGFAHSPDEGQESGILAKGVVGRDGVQREEQAVARLERLLQALECEVHLAQRRMEDDERLCGRELARRQREQPMQDRAGPVRPAGGSQRTAEARTTGANGRRAEFCLPANDLSA